MLTERRDLKCILLVKTEDVITFADSSKLIFLLKIPVLFWGTFNLEFRVLSMGLEELLPTGHNYAAMHPTHPLTLCVSCILCHLRSMNYK